MKNRQGYTLVELVVVILILGILAGVAAPKLLNTSGDATDNSLKQTLSIVRDAIELYAAQNSGSLPPCSGDGTGVGNFHEQLSTYIRGTFPICPVGATNNLISPTASATPAGSASPTSGWTYSTTTGAFICSLNAATANTSDDAGIFYDEL